MLATHPGIRLEAGPGTVAGSIAGIRALAAALPGLRFTIDTGHVASWGEDPVEVLDLADHVQLRQAAAGRPQLYPDKNGDVDFRAVIARLRELDYPGDLSIEYFDLPDWGFPLEDPVAHAVALAEYIRPLLPALGTRLGFLRPLRCGDHNRRRRPKDARRTRSVPRPKGRRAGRSGSGGGGCLRG